MKQSFSFLVQPSTDFTNLLEYIRKPNMTHEVTKSVRSLRIAAARPWRNFYWPPNCVGGGQMLRAATPYIKAAWSLYGPIHSTWIYFPWAQITKSCLHCSKKRGASLVKTESGLGDVSIKYVPKKL